MIRSEQDDVFRPEKAFRVCLSKELRPSNAPVIKAHLTFSEAIIMCSEKVSMRFSGVFIVAELTKKQSLAYLVACIFCNYHLFFL